MPTELAESAVLTRETVGSIEQYRAAGGCRGLEQALASQPSQVLRTLNESGLRGRGGAGFPTARKWDGILNTEGAHHFAVANGAEGEPGTFKDRFLMRRNPYLSLEGLMIATHTVGAERAYFGVKAHFERELQVLNRALDEFAASYEIASRVEIVPGPDEYLFGEEKALLEVIEGGLPLPRVFPPYIHGLFTGAYGGAEINPTAVNNVETLAHVAMILRNGAPWFRSMGAQDTPGTMIFTVSGDVRRPVVQELPLGLSMRELIYEVAGGPKVGGLKAAFPGLANGLIAPEQLDAKLSFDGMREAGVSLGSAGFVVYDDSACMLEVAYQFSRFLHIESCNQCPSCKIGSRVIMNALDRLREGLGTTDDLNEVVEACGMVENNQRCYLPTSTRSVVSGILDRYPEDFKRHLQGERCDLNHEIQLPKIVDYSEEEGFTFDPLYAFKRPDWSYDLPGGQA